MAEIAQTPALFYHVGNVLERETDMDAPECSCDNSNVLFVREAKTPDGRTNKYYKCLSCGRDQMVTEKTSNEPSE